ncbi:MAG: 7-carboxy-7-deazaguanine synthase QueE [Sulfolobales archaeon]
MKIPADYRFMRTSDRELAVSEMFKSYQGEGPTAGYPAIFLRLQGCNLLCRWCDTIDIWVRGEIYSIDHILDMWEARGWIKDLLNGYMLVITGGEPLMRQSSITTLLKTFIERYGFKPRVEIETNGTIEPRRELIELVDQFNVSPKLSNSGMPLSIRYREAPLRTLVNSGKAIFKFVVMDESDIEEVLWYIDSVPLPRDRVYLMPESRSREEYLSRVEMVEKLCREYGFKLSPRLHLVYGWK